MSRPSLQQQVEGVALKAVADTDLDERLVFGRRSGEDLGDGCIFVVLGVDFVSKTEQAFGVGLPGIVAQ